MNHINPLLAFRIGLGLSPEEMAMFLDVDREQVGRLERDEEPLPPRLANKIVLLRYSARQAIGIR